MYIIIITYGMCNNNKDQFEQTLRIFMRNLHDINSNNNGETLRFIEFVALSQENIKNNKNNSNIVKTINKELKAIRKLYCTDFITDSEYDIWE